MLILSKNKSLPCVTPVLWSYPLHLWHVVSCGICCYCRMGGERRDVSDLQGSVQWVIICCCDPNEKSSVWRSPRNTNYRMLITEFFHCYRTFFGRIYWTSWTFLNRASHILRLEVAYFLFLWDVIGFVSQTWRRSPQAHSSSEIGQLWKNCASDITLKTWTTFSAN